MEENVTAYGPTNYSALKIFFFFFGDMETRGKR